ncbi:MAG: hypothetical protein ACTSXD_11625 [Candidatus Heimdallarchaeaceae archaeon]
MAEKLIIEFEKIDEEGKKVMEQRIKSYVIDQAFSFMSSGAYKIIIPRGKWRWVYWEDKQKGEQEEQRNDENRKRKSY